MPYTLAHPAAVLPLRSASRRHLALAPLAIGATMPDVQYFMRLSAEGHFTHTLPGLLLVCLPVVIGLAHLTHRSIEMGFSRGLARRLGGGAAVKGPLASNAEG